MSPSSLLVSIVVAVKNEERHLGTLLDSIAAQDHPMIETIVVDNFSTDRTAQIAARADVFIQRGPERSAQRNAGWHEARGAYVFFLDADMVLTPRVVSACVAKAEHTSALVVPERSFGVGYWAACKALERECYVGDASVEAPRFFERSLLERLGGYDEALTGFEDWDLARRARALTRVDRVDEYILHDEGRLRLSTTVRKKMYYARDFATFAARHGIRVADIVPVRPAFLRNVPRLARRPLHGVGVLVMKAAEFTAGGVALGIHLLRRRLID